jgi:hypothetical protein
MKTVFYTLTGLLLLNFLSACGDKSKSNRNSSLGVCGSGLVNTQYGCLQQGMCPAGQAQINNNQCVAATQNQCSSGYVYSANYGGCLPQGNCPAGQAVYGNQCVQVSNNSGYNNGYNNNSGYNNGFNNNQGYNYNQGYGNQGYNQGYGNQGYNQGYGNQGYNNQYYDPYWNYQQYYGW